MKIKVDLKKYCKKFPKAIVTPFGTLTEGANVVDDEFKNSSIFGRLVKLGVVEDLEPKRQARQAKRATKKAAVKEVKVEEPKLKLEE